MQKIYIYNLLPQNQDQELVCGMMTDWLVSTKKLLHAAANYVTQQDLSHTVIGLDPLKNQ